MIYTIGHAHHSADEFLRLLSQNGVVTVVDIRSLAGSRRSPQFNEENMKQWLPDYLRMPLLGGRRRTKNSDPSVNAGWINASFKSYADYTLTFEYSQGVNELVDLSTTKTVAIMCGEPVPWRCHRTIVSNSLVARGVTVSHIMPNGDAIPHRLGLYGATPQLHMDGTVTYPTQAGASETDI